MHPAFSQLTPSMAVVKSDFSFIFRDLGKLGRAHPRVEIKTSVKRSYGSFGKFAKG
jgi:hypothetical protein